MRGVLSSTRMARDRRGQLDALLDVELVLPRADGAGPDASTVPDSENACAASRSSLPSLAPGMRLGKYRLERLLGAGGMGMVWEARDVDLDRAVALKVLNPTLAGSDVARSRLVREARAIIVDGTMAVSAAMVSAAVFMSSPWGKVESRTLLLLHDRHGPVLAYDQERTPGIVGDHLA